MKRFPPVFSLLAVLAPTLLPPVHGAEVIVESLSFNVVREYNAGSNEVDESVTTDEGNGISLETFKAEVAEAFDNGLGGVIDFEVQFIGEPLVAVDKSLVTAYTWERFKEDGKINPVNSYRAEVLDSPDQGDDDDPYSGGIADILDGSDERLLYDPSYNPAVVDPGNDIFVLAPVDGYTFTQPPGEDEILASEVIDSGSGASGFDLIDPDRTTVVQARFDRYSEEDLESSFDLPLNPILEDLAPIGATLVGRFGEGGAQTLTIYRGPQHITEGALASRDEPGRRDFNPINDEYYFNRNVRPDNNSYIPTSGNFLLGGGTSGGATAKDLLFDPREQVVAFGFTNCNFANFQYYQGPGSPDNTNNLIVDAWFTDGTKSEFRGTTFQRNGGALDQFFGIRAPEGEFLARVQIRVLGRNFRTFTNLDDFGFIVTPATPFIGDGAEASGVVGRDFFHRLDIQREPTSVEIPDLPGGLSFDLETGIISGIPQAAGTFTSDVIMTNGVGTRTETLTLVFVAEDPAFDPPVITSPSAAIAILGREFSYSITSDPEALSSFAIVRRDNGDETFSLTSLESIGFSLSSGVISGKALRSDVVGRYEIEIYVNTAGGSTVKTLVLDIFPPTPEPNFDGSTGNVQTDLFFFDRDTGEISITLTPDPADLPTADLSAATVLTGLAPGTKILLGDFNGDSNTDFITYDPASGLSQVHLMDGVVALSRSFANFGPNSGWEFIGAGDVNIDGVVDVFLSNPDKAWTIVRVLGVVDDPSGMPVPYLVKSPFVFFPDGIDYGLMALADFDGNGSSDALWRHGETDTYTFTPFSDKTFSADVNPYTGYLRDSHQTFTMEAGYVPVFAGDLNGDGSTDLVWENAEEGVLALWLMSGPSVPAGLLDSDTGVASAGTDTLLASSDLIVAITGSDLNGDNRADLILQEPQGGAYLGVLFDGAGLKDLFQIELMEDGVTPRPKQVRSNTTGVRTESVNASFTLLDKFPVPGEPLPLAADEALSDYQIYEQATDDEGVPLWTIDGFHARPVVNTAAPLAGRDVFFDGMHGPGEALRNYTIFQRDGDDTLGRPKVKLSTGFPPLPQQKRINKPQAASGTEDRTWTPVAPSEPGVDYDARGRRGFLQAVDILGNPQFDEFGDPIYILWTNGSGETVPEAPGNQPYELDYDRSFSSVAGEIASGGSALKLRAKGDFNGDSNGDLVFRNTETGEYFLYLMDGVAVLEVIPFTEGSLATSLLDPSSPFREPEVSNVLSKFELWQQANYTSPAPLEGFLLYAQGVEDVDAGVPGTVEGYTMSGGIHDGDFVIEFDFRNDDPDLGYGLRATSDLESAFADIGLIFIEAAPVGGKPVDRVVVKPDEAPVTQRFYQVLFDFVP